MSREIVRSLDARLWKLLFGPEDYMSLHPPVGLRLRIASRLPLQMILGSKKSKEPIFIVGAPRSGTTLLFSLLAASSHLRTFGQESHWVWERFHHPKTTPNHTQIIEESDLSDFACRFITGCYGAAFGNDRFVDKNPTNSMRIKAIHKLFPDAHFVFIHRNGPDNVASLIDCWINDHTFHGFDVPRTLNISGYNKQKWVMLLQPNWQSVADQPIENVCAHQWASVNDYALDNCGEIPARQWHLVRYESLFESAEMETRRLCDEIRLPYCDGLKGFVSNISARVINTSTRPGLGKWKERHLIRIQAILPQIRTTMERLGYSDYYVD